MVPRAIRPRAWRPRVVPYLRPRWFPNRDDSCSRRRRRSFGPPPACRVHPSRRRERERPRTKPCRAPRCGDASPGRFRCELAWRGSLQSRSRSDPFGNASERVTVASVHEECQRFTPLRPRTPRSDHESNAALKSSHRLRRDRLELARDLTDPESAAYGDPGISWIQTSVPATMTKIN